MRVSLTIRVHDTQMKSEQLEIWAVCINCSTLQISILSIFGAHLLTCVITYVSCTGATQVFNVTEVGSGPIHLERLECLGSESSILQCVHHFDAMSCSHLDDVTVQCQG